MVCLNSRVLEKVYAVCQAILSTVIHPHDAGVNDEFSAVVAGRVREKHLCAVGGEAVSRCKGNSISLGMDGQIALGLEVFMLAMVHTRRRTVVSGRQDPAVSSHDSTDIETIARGPLGNDCSHFQQGLAP
jgi:hypothetical protein